MQQPHCRPQRPTSQCSRRQFCSSGAANCHAVQSAVTMLFRLYKSECRSGYSNCRLCVLIDRKLQLRCGCCNFRSCVHKLR
ncbi:hypothetical protein LSTR_LSTR009436 [Laodelphax striatellus]|uniref:Uncharacterized protein n=1 Tax=Laodelphax striatellus TaxID=195883 RepID=A0A482WQ36_LAOST|nr:hypothetical protein LSTR_LSTR009436 [Laodelphax striatellus]